jgi:Extensin-like protein C-terminus
MGDLTNVNWNKNQPAPTQAIRMIHANFPQVKNLGIYVCRNIKGTNTKSAHAQGRALDIGLNAPRPAERVIGDALFHALIRAAHNSGIDNVIWNRQIWSVEHGGPRAWIGNYKSGAAKNPHTDQIHMVDSRWKPTRVVEIS